MSKLALNYMKMGRYKEAEALQHEIAQIKAFNPAVGAAFIGDHQLLVLIYMCECSGSGYIWIQFLSISGLGDFAVQPVRGIGQSLHTSRNTRTHPASLARTWHHLHGTTCTHPRNDARYYLPSRPGQYARTCTHHAPRLHALHAPSTHHAWGARQNICAGSKQTSPDLKCEI
ncbi:hypothetical protein BDP27DRAFT_1370190 [Rhodocollybia butyracea]|uniref:Uncharacterized protein n=1 Tax=Rhodocollybia butyracea TaxID=206335 RepID=A0A9P5PCE9_9AGAR|nr:hypothetical protein BDP27DRAFT_1370190 [Rhodocollybia butyracea]